MSNTAAAVCGATTVGLFSTGVGIPVALLSGLGIATSVVSGLISLAVKRKLLGKFSKHDRICTLAAAKYNSINQLIATALQDQKISDEEYKLVMEEREKYMTLKSGMSNGKCVEKGTVDAEVSKLISAASKS